MSIWTSKLSVVLNFLIFWCLYGWEEILLFSVFIIAFFSEINPVFILFCFCNSCFLWYKTFFPEKELFLLFFFQTNPVFLQVNPFFIEPTVFVAYVQKNPFFPYYTISFETIGTQNLYYLLMKLVKFTLKSSGSNLVPS